MVLDEDVKRSELSFFSLTLWKDFKSIFKRYFGYECFCLEDIVKHSQNKGANIVWHELYDWEDLEDIEILKKLADLNRFNGEIYVVTEASYRDGLAPFKLDGADLKRFVKAHLEFFKECFFNGDVLIIAPKSLSIWAFHHEGVFAFIGKDLDR